MKMNHDEAKKLLVERGYKFDSTMNLEPDTYYYYKRIKGATECRLNERSPSVGISIYDTMHNDINYISMKVNLRAETVTGDWCDIGWYSMPLDRLEDLSTFEYLIEMMWEKLN